MLASQPCSPGAQFLTLLQQEPELTSLRRPAGISSASLHLLAAQRHRNQGPRNDPTLFCICPQVTHFTSICLSLPVE